MRTDLDLFYSAAYEKSINMKMMYYGYEFPYDEIYEYVKSILDIPIKSYLDYIKQNSFDDEIQYRDIYQFSSFQNCTTNLCKVLHDNGDPGFSFYQVGELLQNDGKQRTEYAKIKYGENQLKTGESLGLVHSLASTYYLTAIGMVYIDLDQDDQNRLLTRLILRDKLAINLIKLADEKKINVREYLKVLADSTYMRRKGNIKRIIKVLSDSDEYDFSNIVNNLYFPIIREEE